MVHGDVLVAGRRGIGDTQANLSAATGSFIDGNIVNHASLQTAFFASGAVVGLALALVLVSLKRQASRELVVARY